MPKIKKSSAEKAFDMLTGILEMHQKVHNLSDKILAHRIRASMNERTFRRKVLDPGTFKLNELVVAVKVLHISEEELMGCIRLMLEKES